MNFNDDGLLSGRSDTKPLLLILNLIELNWIEKTRLAPNKNNINSPAFWWMLRQSFYWTKRSAVIYTKETIIHKQNWQIKLRVQPHQRFEHFGASYWIRRMRTFHMNDLLIILLFLTYSCELKINRKIVSLYMIIIYSEIFKRNIAAKEIKGYMPTIWIEKLLENWKKSNETSKLYFMTMTLFQKLNNNKDQECCLLAALASWSLRAVIVWLAFAIVTPNFFFFRLIIAFMISYNIIFLFGWHSLLHKFVSCSIFCWHELENRMSFEKSKIDSGENQSKRDILNWKVDDFHLKYDFFFSLSICFFL